MRVTLTLAMAMCGKKLLLDAIFERVPAEIFLKSLLIILPESVSGCMQKKF